VLYILAGTVALNINVIRTARWITRQSQITSVRLVRDLPVS
jgi:hypothetical protein